MDEKNKDAFLIEIPNFLTDLNIDISAVEPNPAIPIPDFLKGERYFKELLINPLACNMCEDVCTSCTDACISSCTGCQSCTNCLYGCTLSCTVSCTSGCISCTSSCTSGCTSSCTSSCTSCTSCTSSQHTHTWVKNHHEAGSSSCSSPSGTSHPHSMHDKCSSCGACRSSGSNASWSETTACVSDGCWDNVRCSRCNKLIRTQEHHHSGGSSATCTSPAKCKCGKTNIGSALGHSFSSDAEYCKRGCGTKNPNYVKPHTHNWKYTDWQSNGSSGCKRLKYCDGAGTCPVGASEETKPHSFSGDTCTDCGYTKPHTHTWVSRHHEAGSSDCSNSSGTSHPHAMHDKCSSCGACRSSGSNASWKEVVTCVSDGCWDNVRCSRCNTLIRTQEHHHSGGSPATCTSPAKCKCGKTTIGSALGHDWTSWWDNPNTCEKTRRCSRCFDREYETSHKGYGSPSCTEGGKCYCGGSTSGSALGHHFVNGICTRCGASSGDTTVCQHPNCTPTSWVANGDNGCFSHKVCLTCGKSITGNVTSHSYSIISGYGATTQSMHTVNKSCGKCGYTKGFSESHTFDSSNTCACGREKGSCNPCVGEWSAWRYKNENECERKMYCKTCSAYMQSETQYHKFANYGEVRPLDPYFHIESGYCKDCLRSLAQKVAHTEGNCICGVVSGGGGGGSTMPQIVGFTVKPSPNAMKLNISVTAKNASKYIYTLGSGTDGSLIATSKLIPNSTYSFDVIPNQKYTVVIEAFNLKGYSDIVVYEITTPNGIPELFKWKTPPTVGADFASVVTKGEWQRLQNIVNAWRQYYKQTAYNYLLVVSGDTYFSIPETGHDFTYIHFNQIVNALKTIPDFKGSLPNKKTSNPRQWLASEFKGFENAIASLQPRALSSNETLLDEELLLDKE